MRNKSVRKVLSVHLPCPFFHKREGQFSVSSLHSSGPIFRQFFDNRWSGRESLQLGFGSNKLFDWLFDNFACLKLSNNFFGLSNNSCNSKNGLFFRTKCLGRDLVSHHFADSVIEFAFSIAFSLKKGTKWSIRLHLNAVSCYWDLGWAIMELRAKSLTESNLQLNNLLYYELKSIHVVNLGCLWLAHFTKNFKIFQQAGSVT